MGSMATEQMGWIELKGARILVVDDDAQAVRALREVLEGVGATVESAMSVRAALERLGAGGPFDAAVVDYFLVGQHGKALVRPLREQLVSTLMISGVERVDVANQAISAGANDFMLKPFEVPAFLTCVSKQVAKTRLWRQNLSEIRLGVRSERKDRAANAFDEQIDKVVALLAARARLSNRETKVVRLIVDSLSTEQIAARLGNSISTVKHHDKKAREKLGVETRDQLRQLVMRMLKSRGPLDE